MPTLLYHQRHRLRHGLSRRMMSLQTLVDIMNTHRRHPWQRLEPFSWRHGPEGKVTIYDYDMPRRRAPRWDEIHGLGDVDWQVHSYVCNCPDAEITRDGGGGKPGYRRMLIQLVDEGCVIPSRCLDDWLESPGHSRTICAPELRLFYRSDL